MPWEKTFDLDDATDKAMQVFWKKGYEGTSMADLIKAMQINKGSLYNAFGSKKALFDRALARYDQQSRAVRLAELREWDDPVAAIDAFFSGMIEEAQQDPSCLGCFVINTAQDLPNQPPEVAEIVTTSLNEIEGFFCEMITRGLETGQIAGTLNAAETAKGLLSLFVGLRVLSRGAGSPETLSAVRNSAMALIKV